ncbi:MAG TPA: ribonuclease H-like domain-containing protein [Anaerolineales bacterium]|nr:ribonuclease H-like domain-containing protein [Anaerolineales bacterium]
MSDNKKTTLAEKLKSLGVKKGASDLPTPKVDSYSIDSVVTGAFTPTPRGEVFIAKNTYPQDYIFGEAPLLSSFPLSLISQWAKDARISDFPLEKFAFLDTETSGLSGGTGTYAFLVGVARFIDSDYVLQQFFMRDPAEEPALLEGLAKFLAPCKALVTFNGKAFDMPLLSTRYRLHQIPIPYKDYAHVDLLPLARRLWRDRLESRTLKFLEEHVLGFTRSSEEVPGYEVPWLYFDYLRTGDARPLGGVFYHNDMDVVAMAALLAHMNDMLENPYGGKVEHGLDFVALGKLFEDLGHREQAARLFERGLEFELNETDFGVAVKRLSILQKRRGDMGEAIRLWEDAAKEGHLYAFIELAKFYEHKEKNIKSALKWTKSALKRLKKIDMPAYMHNHWEEEIEHRLKRLNRKAGL